MALAHVPDPDLLIRTGGEQRYQQFPAVAGAYSELYFSDRLWPEFDEAALDEAIADFRSAANAASARPPRRSAPAQPDQQAA